MSEHGRAGGTLQATFPRVPNASRLARMWLGASLREANVPLSGESVELAQLMAAELVTNVMHHTGTRPNIAVDIGERSVTVSVVDENAALPIVQDREGQNTHGLRMVDYFSSSWGAVPLPEGGKRVWFELAFDLQNEPHTDTADPSSPRGTTMPIGD